ncbi:MAG: hypothetical protein M1133_04345 [Armatimonadetes bacterium]|nr:hypothetical protein [Armatimonadota bacterium]
MDYRLDRAGEEAARSRLPVFFTSDADYDRFVNEYFMRHLSVDQGGVYFPASSPGATGMLWAIEWDMWFLPWVDRAALGIRRQSYLKYPQMDMILTPLLQTPVDKYGYAWGAMYEPSLERLTVMSGYCPGFGWKWPLYNYNTTVKTLTGWEFNDTSDGNRDKWFGKDITLESGYIKGCLEGKITGPSPEIVSPCFDVDVFQVPMIELDVAYQSTRKAQARRLVDSIRVYWTTSDSRSFTQDKMVDVKFCDLPPKEYPQYYVKPGARYELHFPMYLHPRWGREGRRITRLKVVLAGPDAKGASVSVNYVRATYDLRHVTTNATLINAACKFFMWSGDEKFLKSAMPRLRMAMLFMNEHLKGRRTGLLDFAWMAGHDGLGGTQVGHGLNASYWDLLPSGRYDLESSLDYFYALKSMAELEECVRRRHIEIPTVKVIGPDNKSTLAYRENPESLRLLAAKSKSAIEDKFWMKDTGRFCRNVDIHGRKHDYGFVHFNLQALVYGVGSKAQRDSILSWLDGRIIPGDTSCGKDIYKWKFAPRSSTRHNEDYYTWSWNTGKSDPMAAPCFEWGNQVQDGGAVPFTSLFDIMARTRTGIQAQIDRAFERTLEIKDWYNDVKSAGGEGDRFYRAYYEGHLERGTLQGPTPGGLGLDHEFLSDSGMGTLFVPYAFLGLDAPTDSVLAVSPAIPTRLGKVGVTNVFYHGNYLTITAGRDYVSFEKSRITNSAGLKAMVSFNHVPQRFELLIDGKCCRSYRRKSGGGISVVTALRSVSIVVRAKG